MDVGFYLGELLMKQGEVRVPGLGNFLQVRMSAYYNEAEAAFYPPFNKIHFEHQADTEDDALAEYLVSKKGISLASAKYFIDKYITNLRQQAIIADVPLSNLGIFYTERAELSFKPNDRLADDSDFFGYAPVSIYRVNAIPGGVEPSPVPDFIFQRPKPQPDQTEPSEEESLPPFTDEDIECPVLPVYDEAFLELPEEEEEVRRSPVRIILIILLIIAVLGGGLFALYRYEPDTFNKLQFWKNNKTAAPVTQTPKAILPPKPDSLYTDSAKNTLTDSTVAGADTVTIKRFELISGKGFQNLWGANEAVKKYRAMGLKDAKLSEDRPGTLIKISIATFNSISESEAFRQKLIDEGKLTNGAYTIEIPVE